jgi:nicotinic acid mononucleotide adenylyltransferase
MERTERDKNALLASTIAKRVEKVFLKLKDYPYVSEGSLQEFHYYREHFLASLARIGERVRSGELCPLDLKDFPREFRLKHYKLRVALFIGSFDPFQMTHLATALRYLGSKEARADVVFIAPEGGASTLKPNRSEYAYRLDILNRQIKGIFEPFIVSLDMGADADTMEIVRRFMALFPGATVDVTHLIGSDVLPFAARLMREDLSSWKAASKRLDVNFTYRMHTVRRQRTEGAVRALRDIRSLGVEAVFDRRLIDYPSSTDFRESGAFTIVFPTENMLSHLEVLFRYGLNKPWMREGDPGPASSG